MLLMKKAFLPLLAALGFQTFDASGWIAQLDGSSLPQANGWAVDAADGGSIVDLGGGNSGIRQSNPGASIATFSRSHTNAAGTLAARFRVDSYRDGPLNLLQLSTHSNETNLSPVLAIGIRGDRFYLVRVYTDEGFPEDALLADLGPIQTGVFNEAFLYIDNATKHVRLFWNDSLRYTGFETNSAYLLNTLGAAHFGASTAFLQGLAGIGTATFDWVRFGNESDLPLRAPFIPWSQYLDGSAIPGAPWLVFQDPGGAGTTEVVEFNDSFNDGMNQAMRITSNSGANEYYIGAFEEDETFAGARFALQDFSPTGKENIFCVTTRSQPNAPCPSVTLVDGRYKLWNYVESDTELLDIGPADTGVFHSVYIYAHHEGYVKVWWDGSVIFDGFAPRTNPYQGYFEWGSGSWQFDASDTIDFDWVAFGAVSRSSQLITTPAHGDVFQNPGAGFNFTIISAESVSTNAIVVRVNGVDRSSALTISGTDNLRQGLLGGLVSNQFYQVTVIFTNAIGATFSNLIVFDTFSQANLTIEAEDWNYDGGQFIDNPVPAAQTLANSYFARTAFEDIDQEELSTVFEGALHDYRDLVLVGTEVTGDVRRKKYIDAQATDPAVQDYNVGWIELTEWLNYTRTFPTGTFNIYGRFANGNIGQSFEAALDKVDGATTDTQTTTPVGSFRGPPGRGWQTYDFVPLTDANGTVVTVAMNGVETIRVTALAGGYNANFYMFIPASAPPPTLNVSREGSDLRLNWSGTTHHLETAPSITGPWSTVTTIGNIHTVAPTSGRAFFRLGPN